MIALLCILCFGLTARCIRNVLFMWSLLWAAAADCRRRVIPEGALIAGCAAWAVFLPLVRDNAPEAPEALCCAAAVFIVLFALLAGARRIFGKKVLGGGDVKLLSVSALYTGFSGTLLTLLFSCAFGLLTAVIFRKSGKEQFPFGPAIALSAGIVLLYREPLLQLIP